MAFPTRLLADHEQLVFDKKPHWMALVPAAFWTLVAVAALVFLLGVVGVEGILLLVILGLVVVAWLALSVRPFLNWQFTQFVLTSDRLITRTGVISKRSKEIPLERINDVSFSQGVFERMVGAGDLMIESAGERGQTLISNVAKPEEVQLTIYKETEANNNRMMSPGRSSEPSVPEQIEALARLKNQGVISETEFEAKKEDLLRRM